MHTRLYPIVPPPPDEEQRLAALAAYNILDTPPEPFFAEVATLAAGICKVSCAAVSFLDRDRVWFKTEIGLGVREVPRDGSFCAHTIRQEDVLVVPDATEDLRFAGAPLAARFRFYAGAQIRGRDGHKLGVLAVFDGRPHHLDETQRRTLAALVVPIEAQLELRYQAEALRDAASLVRARRQALEAGRDDPEARVLSAQISRIEGRVRALSRDGKLPEYLDETAREILAETGRALTGGARESMFPRDHSGNAEHSAMRTALQVTLADLDAALGEVAAGSGRTANVEAIARLTESMAAIRQSADDTVRIMRTLDEIAFQTSVLALQAAHGPIDPALLDALPPICDEEQVCLPRTDSVPPVTRREPRPNPPPRRVRMTEPPRTVRAVRSR